MSSHLSKRPLYISVPVITAALISWTTIHEFFHLATGRLLGIPARFANFTAVGIPASDVPNYSASSLTIMNGLAPFLTIVLFGVLGYALLMRHRKDAISSLIYLCTWWVIWSLPYLGMQFMFIATPARPSGTGADFAVIADFFGVPMTWRAIIGVLGYGVYIALSIPLVRLLKHLDPSMEVVTDRSAISLWRYILGSSAIALGIVSVVAGNILLVKENETGLWAIALGAFSSWGIGSALLTRWSMKSASVIWRDWLLPLIIASLVLVPLGLEGNDYLTDGLMIIPIVTGIAFFSTYQCSNQICKLS